MDNQRIKPIQYNLHIVKGTTFEPITFTLDNGGKPPEPIDLTGYTAYAQARHPKGVLDFSPTVDGPAGSITLPEISDEDTLAIILSGTVHWDLLLEDPDGKVTGPYVRGDLTFSETISHTT